MLVTRRPLNHSDHRSQNGLRALTIRIVVGRLLSNRLRDYPSALHPVIARARHRGRVVRAFAKNCIFGELFGSRHVGARWSLAEIGIDELASVFEILRARLPGRMHRSVGEFHVIWPTTSAACRVETFSEARLAIASALSAARLRTPSFR